MALVYATKNGDWSDTTVWNTGSLPLAADVVRPNNFTVTIDINVDVLELRNDAGGGAVAGGSFILNGGVDLDANITVGQPNIRFLTFSDNATSTIIGTITNLSSNALYLAIINSGSGTLNINGDVIYTQSNGTGNIGFIQNDSDGIINITGTVNGNTLGANRVQCVQNTSIGAINIVGNVNSPTTSGALFFTIVNLSTGTITINGDVTSTASTTIDNRSSGSVTIIGTLHTSSQTGTLIINSSGIVSITGNISHTQTNQALTTLIDNTGSGNITIIGDVSSAITVNVNAASGNLIRNNSSGTISIIGELSLTSFANTTSNTSVSLLNNSTGIINITGNVIGQNRTGASESSGILNASVGIINITGTIQAGATFVTGGSFAIRNTGLGVVNVIGSVQGNGGGSRLAGIGNDGGGTINITGNVIGGSTGLAVVNNSTGTVTVNGNAIGGSSFIAIEGVNAAGNTIIEKAIYSAQGQSPIGGYIKFKTGTSEIDVLREDSVIVTLRDPLNVSGLLPSPGDVRSGTTYNSGSSTGTLAMPAANLVQLGVPVDNTVGTGNLTPQDFWNYLISNGFATGSIGERLKETATTDIVGNIVASFNI